MYVFVTCSTEMAPLLTNESFKATGSVEGPAELWIRPGKAYATAVRIDEAGITLKWEFTTYPKVGSSLLVSMASGIL